MSNFTFKQTFKITIKQENDTYPWVANNIKDILEDYISNEEITVEEVKE